MQRPWIPAPIYEELRQHPVHSNDRQRFARRVINFGVKLDFFLAKYFPRVVEPSLVQNLNTDVMQSRRLALRAAMENKIPKTDLPL